MFFALCFVFSLLGFCGFCGSCLLGSWAICSVEECSIEEIEHGHKVYLAGTASPKKCGNAMKINEVSTPQTDVAGPNRMKSGSPDAIQRSMQPYRQ